MSKINSVKSVFNIMTRRARRLTWEAGLGIFIVLLLLVGVGAYTANRLTEDKASGLACGDDSDIIARSREALESNILSVKPELIDDIKQKPSYTKDPNCLVVLTNYYIQLSDYENAKQSFAQLESIDQYDTYVVYDIKASGNGAANYERIRNDISFLKKQIENQSSNIIQGPTGEPSR